MSVGKITKVIVVLILGVVLNSFVGAEEVVVSRKNDITTIDVGTVLPGGTKDLTIKLDESSSCDSIKGSVDTAASDDGWVGGGGRSVIYCDV